MKPIESSCVIVCSIVRDAAAGLRNNIPIIRQICARCKDYRIVVFENDSKDDTKNILANWAADDPDRIKVFCEDTKAGSTIPPAKEVTVNPFFSRRRIEKMMRLRNQYMDYLWTNDISADYLMVIDLDVDRIFPSAILSSFEEGKEWDAVTAFGYSTSPKLCRRYHDTYALTLWGDGDKPQTEAKIISNADRFGGLKANDDWVRVCSAFGGCAIYRYEAVKGLRYKTLDNDDPRVEVKCEHFSLYKQMSERGFDRFYINPAMKLHYQKLTLKIVLNAIKRKLGL